jgi:hypothetical protein
MRLIRIDNETVLNLGAVATIKFLGGTNGRTATVNFLSTTQGADNFISETFSGEAAENLYRTFPSQAAELSESQLDSGETIPDFRADFARTKAWYFLKGTDRRRYFIAFINAKGACSMRTFDADTGRFLSKKYHPGNYQQHFTDIVRNAVELTVNPQPNLERDCKVQLPESAFSQMKKQVITKSDV